MNVSQQVINIINEICKKIGISIDWTQKNVMPQIVDFMHRYIKYETYTSIVWLVIGVAMVVTAILLINKGRKLLKDYETEDIGIILITVSVFLIIFGTVISINQIMDIIKINTIPETYFIDYIKNLIPSNN